MTQRYLEDFAVGQTLTPPPARGVWHPDNPKCSGLQTAVRGLANKSTFRPGLFVKKTGAEFTFGQHRPTISDNSPQPRI
jgi:hypothetical protein